MNTKLSNIRGPHGRARRFLSLVCGVSCAASMCAVLTLATNLPLHAQERRAAIEEVLVTAQKREETLQDAPVAVSAFTAEDIEANKVVEFGEIVNLAPSVILRKQSASHANYAFGVRGVTSGETQLAIDSVLAVYVDGVYMGRLTGSAFDISDTERVELLRGPQGTLYGRNATGGAINIISAKPERSPGLRNHFSGGERGFWRNQITVNSGAAEALGGEIMLRANFSKWNHRGLIRNEPFVPEMPAGGVGPGPTANTRGSFIGDQDSEASRLSLRYAGERFSADYVYDRSTKLGNAQITQLTGLDDFGDPAGLGAEYAPGAEMVRSFWGSIQDSGYVQNERYQVSKFYDQPETSDIEGHSLVMEWQLPAGYTFKSITGVREWDSDIDDIGTDFGSFLASQPGDTTVLIDNFDHDNDPMTPGITVPAPFTNVGGVVDQLAIQTGAMNAALSPNAMNELIIGGQGELLGFVAPGVPVSLFRASRSSRQDQLSQEFQLSGLSFDERLDWVLGLYYFEEQADERNPQHNAVPGHALPFFYGVRSVFDPAQLWGMSAITGFNPVTMMPTMQSFPEFVAENFPAEAALIPDNLDMLPEAERLAAQAAVTDALGYTFRGRGSAYLCNGATRTASDIHNPMTNPDGLVRSVPGVQDPFATMSSADCAGKTVLGGTNIFNYGTDNQAWALYWHGRIRIIDSVTLALGLRYTEDDRAAYLEYEPTNGGRRINASDDWENLTWDISVDWQIIDEINFYGRLANSYRAGGYNARAFTAASFQTPFDEENITSFELGVKTQFAGDKVRINAAAYASEWTDAQVATFRPSLGGANSDISNAGELSISGFELELLTVPFTGFTLGFSMGVLDAEYDQFAEGNRTLTAALTDQVTMEVREPDVPYSPESNWSFFVDYQFPLYSWGQLGLRLDANYTDRFTTNPLSALDDPINDDTDRTLVNMSVSLANIPVRHGDFSVSLWSRNVTNEEYREFVIPFGVYDSVSYGELRRSGFDIVWSY